MNIQSLNTLPKTLAQTYGQLIDQIWLTGLVFTGLIVLRFLVLHFAKGRIADSAARIRWRINTAYIAGLLAVFLLAPIWLPSLRGVLAIIGIFGAGLLIIMKEVFLNLFGWFYIVIRKPLAIGNRVEVNSVAGDVIDIRLLDFAMMEVTGIANGGQSTGRVVHVPNSILFTAPLYNSSKEFSFAWSEVRVPLSPDSNWQKAEKLLKKIAAGSLEKIDSEDKRLSESERLYAIRFLRIESTVYVEFREGAVLLTLRYLTEPRKRRQSIDSIWRAFLMKTESDPEIRLHPQTTNHE